DRIVGRADEGAEIEQAFRHLAAGGGRPADGRADGADEVVVVPGEQSVFDVADRFFAGVGEVEGHDDTPVAAVGRGAAGIVGGLFAELPLGLEGGQSLLRVGGDGE